jgi:hypothetical protein
MFTGTNDADKLLSFFTSMLSFTARSSLVQIVAFGGTLTSFVHLRDQPHAANPRNPLQGTAAAKATMIIFNLPTSGSLQSLLSSGGQ